MMLSQLSDKKFFADSVTFYLLLSISIYESRYHQYKNAGLSSDF